MTSTFSNREFKNWTRKKGSTKSKWVNKSRMTSLRQPSGDWKEQMVSMMTSRIHQPVVAAITEATLAMVVEAPEVITAALLYQLVYMLAAPWLVAPLLLCETTQRKVKPSRTIENIDQDSREEEERKVMIASLHRHTAAPKSGYNSIYRETGTVSFLSRL